MVLTLLFTFIVLFENNWCFSQVPSDEFKTIAVIMLLDLASAFVMYFFFK